jgi:uncharacterized FAD-dependent dehydrogenase
LAAALAVHDRGGAPDLYERGPTDWARDREDPTDIAAGVGGAGLFSDGKFSFYPSATDLWKLRPESDLREAYSWVQALLRVHGLSPPDFPDLASMASVADEREVVRKRYESIKTPFALRQELIGELVQQLGQAVHTHFEVLNVRNSDSGLALQVRGETSSRPAAAAVLAIGRFAPLSFERVLPAAELHFERLEVGVRLEQPADTFFLREDAQMDPKLRFRLNADYECRTFCCCRNGEVVALAADGIRAISGRADKAPTGRSNVGFNVRVLDPVLASSLWEDLLPRLIALDAAVSEPIETFLHGSPGVSAVAALLGTRISDSLRDGLRALQVHAGAGALEAATIHAPAVEGIMNYPVLEHDLRVPREPIWVAGDGVGRFRGLTAALVSGYFAGIRAARFAAS